MEKRSRKFSIHPLFLVFACIVIFLGDCFLFISYFVAVLLHEIGHGIVAKSLGYKLKNVCLLPYGAQLNLKNNIFRTKDEVLIAFAGPIVNIIFAGIFIAVWWLFPVTYAYTEYFVWANIVTALFNFLPIVPLDGSRIILALAGKFGKRQKVFHILNITNCIFAVTMFVMFIISAFYNINYSLGIIAVFLFAGAFEQNTEYEYNSLLHIQKAQMISRRSLPVRFVAVNKEFEARNLFKLINANYYTIVYVIDENLRPVKTVFESDFENIIVNSEKL